MRMVLPIALVAAVAVVGGALLLFTQDTPQPLTTTARRATPATIDTLPLVPSLQPAVRPPARPVTPVYAPRSAEPQTIYRCRDGTGITYSHEPCTGGRVVAQASAVEGYDSKPSVAMTRLVEEGRAQRPAEPRIAMVDRDDRLKSKSDDCATYAKQIRDIDAALLQPSDSRDVRWRDELRQRRQDIRSSQARAHC